MNDKYLNYYVETLTSTLNETVLRNVSMQANARIANETIEEQNKIIEQLSDTSEQDHVINLLREEVESHKAENARLNLIVNEYNEVKSQLNHLETFRNELLKTQQEKSTLQDQVKELSEKIVYLQQRPTKVKKVEKTDSDVNLKDGGTLS